MLKKVIPIVLSFCLIFSISVMAENTNVVSDETATEASEQMPNKMKERGNIGTPPSMQNGEMPPEVMGRFPGNMQNFNQNTKTEQEKGFLGFVKTNSTPITSVILLALAFIFVIFYRRKNY